MRFHDALFAAIGAAILATPSLAAGQEQAAVSAAPTPAGAIAPTIADKPTSTLPVGTPVVVMTNQELSTKANKAGDKFLVTVLHDVIHGAAVVIPKGTLGVGEVTFATDNGGFGKPGILSISLRHLELEGAKVLLDGRYREEGRNKNGATAATWFAVGVFSGFIKGKPGVIPKGRELKARTGEDIAFSPAAPPRAAATADAARIEPANPNLPAPGAPTGQ